MRLATPMNPTERLSQKIDYAASRHPCGGRQFRWPAIGLDGRRSRPVSINPPTLWAFPMEPHTISSYFPETP